MSPTPSRAPAREGFVLRKIVRTRHESVPRAIRDASCSPLAHSPLRWELLGGAVGSKRLHMDKDDDGPASRKGSPFLNTAQAAHYLGLSRKTLEKLRVVGGGPRFRRHRAHV